MPHPDEGLIHAWLDGELDAAEAARIEALVASDPAWATAAAEARGLIAASARIVGALDRVPRNVVPKSQQPARRAARQWIWRAAAAVVLVAGSAVVLQRETPELPVPQPASPLPTAQAPTAATEKTAHAEPARVAAKPVAPPQEGARADARTRDALAQSGAPAAPPSAAPPASAKVSPPMAANAPVAENRSTISKKELEDSKQKTALDKDAASVGDLRAKAAGATGAGGAAAPQRLAAAPLALSQPSCFEQRQPRGEPRDSARRVIRFDAAALADSLRLEKLSLRGDTLAAVHGAFTAVRVRCPAP